MLFCNLYVLLCHSQLLVMTTRENLIRPRGPADVAAKASGTVRGLMLVKLLLSITLVTKKT